MFERMLDKSTQPTYDALESYCGENGGRLNALNAYLTATFQTSREIRFPYGKAYGWCVTHRLGKKLLCDIFAEAGAFTVMVRLSAKQINAAYPAVGENTRRALDGRYPCGDGGWAHCRVQDDAHLADIEALLREKCR